MDAAVFLAVLLAVVGVASKLVTGWMVAAHAGIGVHGRWRTGTTLVARGEFSIVIANLGAAAGVTADLPPVAAAYRDAMLGHPAMREWEQGARAEAQSMPAYDAYASRFGGLREGT